MTWFVFATFMSYIQLLLLLTHKGTSIPTFTFKREFWGFIEKIPKHVILKHPHIPYFKRPPKYEVNVEYILFGRCCTTDTIILSGLVQALCLMSIRTQMS